MLFGIWSFWQQLFVLKEMCILCSLVQIAIWMNGVVDLRYNTSAGCLNIGNTF